MSRPLASFLLLAAAVPLWGATATGLSSFDAIEETLVRYYPAARTFQPDADFTNIVDLGDGAFRMYNRFNAEWWDGDRDTPNRDRQRAEVKGLGPHQHDGETFGYSFTWRLNESFKGTAGFCHLFQLKATNGDSGAPLVTLSIRGDKAVVEGNPPEGKIIAREFPWKPGVWQRVRLRIRTSTIATGELLVSIDGDAFQGRTNVALYRPGSTEYRPKWGLYRRAAVKAPMGDDYVEHRAISALKRPTAGQENPELELEARARAGKTSPAAALEWLQTQPAGETRDLAVASIAALWSETDAAAAMAWVEKQPASPVRRDATGRVFARWADRDVAAASKWLQAHAPRADLDPVIWLFTTDTTYRYVNRDVALAALPLIQNPTLRAAAYVHVLEIWSRSDSAAAVAHVERSAALDAQQKAIVIQKIRRGSGRLD